MANESIAFAYDDRQTVFSSFFTYLKNAISNGTIFFDQYEANGVVAYIANNTEKTH